MIHSVYQILKKEMHRGFHFSIYYQKTTVAMAMQEITRQWPAFSQNSQPTTSFFEGI